MNRGWSRRTSAVVMACLTLTVAGCSTSDPPPRSAGKVHHSRHSAEPSKPEPKKKHFPTGPPMYLDSIAPVSGSTVGVAMPISIDFTTPVKPSARKEIEEHIKLTTSVPVRGAWHWFSSTRVDFRPRAFWKPGTKVSMVASFNHVGDGYGRYGTHSYFRNFRI